MVSTPNIIFNILQSVVISSTGQYQTVVDSTGYIGIVNSSDYGITWTQNQTAPTGANWNGVSMSSTGQYQTVVDNIYIHLLTLELLGYKIRLREHKI